MAKGGKMNNYQPNHCFLQGIYRCKKENGNGYILAIEQESIDKICPKSLFKVVIPSAISDNFNKLTLSEGDKVIIKNAMVYQFHSEYRFKINCLDDIIIISSSHKTIDLGEVEARDKFI